VRLGYDAPLLAALAERLARAVMQDMRRSVKQLHGLASVAAALGEAMPGARLRAHSPHRRGRLCAHLHDEELEGPRSRRHPAVPWHCRAGVTRRCGRSAEAKGQVSSPTVGRCSPTHATSTLPSLAMS